MTTINPAKPLLPYELISTDLPGAFISPAPSADFDPNTASPASLINNGFLWRRPQEGDDPALRAAWDRAFSRPWRAEDRLVPEFEPQIGKTHILKNVKVEADGTYTGGQWAGSVVAGTWTSAVGYWVIPAAAKPAEPQGTEGGWNSSSWVGIDGTFGSDDVLQAGIEQKVDANGNPTYVAWYEWYAPPQPNSPAYVWQTNIPNFSVSPGQTVYCSVQYVSNKTAGYVVFGNEATGQHFSLTLAPPQNATFSGNTAEWIMEAPDGGIPTSSLPAFTPVTFTSAVCCGPNNTSGNPAAADGNVFNIVGFGTALTSVTTGQSTVTIDYAGPEYWIDNDLTAFTGGVPAAPGSALDGYWGTDSSQHVNYIAADGHIHELYIHPGANWIDNDLTAFAGSTGRLAARGSKLDGYWGSDSSQHVNYVSADGHIHELYIHP